MKTKYASVQSFSGQRASVGRAVVMKDGEGAIYSGQIVGISGQDLPIVRVFGCPGNASDDGAYNHSAEYLPHRGVSSEADLDREVGPFWCWPPRV
jgi:hypothetical protein